MILYGLKTKGRFEFSVLAKDTADLESKIEDCYWANFARSSKGSSYSRADFMKNKIKVRIEITEIPEEK